MHLETMDLFCDVARHRSMSRAAELNGITQSAASQRLKTLERELGIQLIDRSTRPLRLTEAGEQYHRGCRMILDRYQQLCQQITTEPTGLVGRVQVSGIYSAGIDLLKQVVRGFEADHPQTQVSITYAQPEDVYERVRAGRADLGILSFPERWTGVAHQPLREEAMVVAARAGHPLTAGLGVHASELDDRDMVMFDAGLPIARRISEYLKQQHAAPNVVQAFDNIDTIKGFIAETDAVAILPARTVRREVTQGTLSMSTLSPQLVRTLGLIFAKGRTLSPVAEAFRDYLVNHQASEDPAEAIAAAGTTA